MKGQKFREYLERISNSIKKKLSSFHEDHDISNVSTNLKSKLKILTQNTFKNTQGFRNLKLTDKLDILLSPINRQKIHSYFIHMLFVVGTYGMAKSIAIVIQSSAPLLPYHFQAPTFQSKAKFTSTINKIRYKDGFNSQSKEIVPVDGNKTKEVDKNLVCDTATRKSALSLKIKNIITLQNRKKSVVGMTVPGERQPQFYREGNNIKALAKIYSILPEKIIIKNLRTGLCEFIERPLKKKRARKFNILAGQEAKKAMKPKMRGIDQNGNTFKIEKDLIKEKLSDINAILTQARAIQIQRPDGSLAFKIVEIVPGSVYSYLGIEDNDIITKINGQEIKSVNEIMNLFGKITNLDSLQISLTKADGSSKDHDYVFERR